MERQCDRRDFLKALGLGAASLAVPRWAFAADDGRPAERPNIIFILTDDQRWDAMGCAGHPWLKTPNMDRLAREGVMFRNAFVTTSLCSPSRASFLTGQYAHSHGVWTNHVGDLRRDRVTFTGRLHRMSHHFIYCKPFVKSLPQRFRHRGHFIKRRDPLLIQPLEYLLCPERGFSHCGYCT